MQKRADPASAFQRALVPHVQRARGVEGERMGGDDRAASQPREHVLRERRAVQCHRVGGRATVHRKI
jgi:hypothetical protein